MTPVDSFLHSVRGAFTPSYDTAWIGAALVAAVATLVVLGRWRARLVERRAGTAAFAAFVAEKRLAGAQTRLLAQLGAAAGAPPLVIGSNLDAFERATAQLLASETPTAASGVARSERDGADDVFSRVHELRRALGFHVVPDHLALSTTRELVPGTHVAVGVAGGEVMEVNEAWFGVIAGPDTTFPAAAPGAALRITFTRDARYNVRCPVLAADPPHAPRKLLLRHDEKPERHQLRATVRVSAQGTAQLVPRTGRTGEALGDGGEATGDGQATAAELIDISVGGLAATATQAISPGTAVHVAITWDGEVYRELPAAVLRCDAKLGGRFLLRLEFRGLPAQEESRLAAAIARHSARVNAERAESN